MEVLFNAPPSSLDAPTILRLVTAFRDGIRRLATGLGGEGLKLISATEMVGYGLKQRADCSGWVPRYLHEPSDRTAPARTAEDLPSLSGEIHLKLPGQSPETIADTIVHEASHKFLGTFDYSYVGVTGSAARRFGDAAAAEQGGGSLEEGKNKARDLAARRTHAGMVRQMVSKGIESVLPIPERSKKPADDESAEKRNAREIYERVRTWNMPQEAVPTLSDVQFTARFIAANLKPPGSLGKSLEEYAADPTKFLAVHGNELDQKAHDVMLTLPKEILLRNADSWTELAITVA
jgi:hypothetical protein